MEKDAERIRQEEGEAKAGGGEGGGEAGGGEGAAGGGKGADGGAEGAVKGAAEGGAAVPAAEGGEDGAGDAVCTVEDDPKFAKFFKVDAGVWGESASSAHHESQPLSLSAPLGPASRVFSPRSSLTPPFPSQPTN